jgi:enoyl-CoA hydratase
MPQDSEILFERRGVAGVITLNRPHALNAVTHGMVRALTEKLAEWSVDSAVSRVIVTAAGERAFSAGGDLRALYELRQAGREAEALAFWRDEYVLNARIKHYRKPYIAIIDGIVMGGGVGVSVHGSHRVAGDQFQFAMPEVGIGFFPDVGATWFLPRMPGALGIYCALTGARLAAAEAVAAGIATHHVRSARLPDAIDALCGNVPVDAVLGAFAEPAGASPIASRSRRDHAFKASRVEDILSTLDKAAASADGDVEWAKVTAAGLRAKCPLSLKIALAQMRRGREWNFDECMRAEFRIVSRVVHGHNFYEGIRALIIDKDNVPHWRPPVLAEVTEAEVERHFAPLARELELP